MMRSRAPHPFGRLPLDGMRGTVLKNGGCKAVLIFEERVL